MPVGKKKSPFKVVPMAVTAGLGIAQGLTGIIGGMVGSGARKDEEIAAQAEFDTQKAAYQNLDTSNLYAGVQNQFSGLQNTFEDLTVNQQQAQFEAQQGSQARANLLSNLQGAAGGSGIAGLAQALANQQQTQGQQISASIGQQEARNQQLAAQGAQGVQRMEQQAQQQVAYGGYLREQGENERQMNLLQLKAGRQQAERDFRGQMQAQKGAIMGGVGDILGAGLQGFASGGGFSKDGFKMDTFLGRTKGITNVTDNIIPTISGTNYTPMENEIEADDPMPFDTKEVLRKNNPEAFKKLYPNG